ncbi:MAG: hypothetical protein DYG86_06220 [Chloroflexi bacterium CFX2]|nr:hypothetical protein [Chloroflexi bacterium CFX2]
MAGIGVLLSVWLNKSDMGAVEKKKTTAYQAMVLRFSPFSREISFRIDDCRARNQFGGYSPSE